MAPYTREGNALTKSSYKLEYPARVLVVDDDRAIRETIRIILEDEGYEVVDARNGAEALEILRESPEPLVVLLDLMMPKLDGAGVLRMVAEDPSLKRRHAYVLITADVHAASLFFQQQLAHLNVPVIQKPFDIDSVLDVVEQMAQRLSEIEEEEISQFSLNSSLQVRQRFAY